jgi:hypothetical protein
MISIPDMESNLLCPTQIDEAFNDVYVHSRYRIGYTVQYDTIPKFLTEQPSEHTCTYSPSTYAKWIHHHGSHTALDTYLCRYRYRGVVSPPLFSYSKAQCVWLNMYILYILYIRGRTESNQKFERTFEIRPRNGITITLHPSA